MAEVEFKIWHLKFPILSKQTISNSYRNLLTVNSKDPQSDVIDGLNLEQISIMFMQVYF